MPTPEETYESWTKEELHDELQNRGLSVGGSKDEQISRLEANDLAAGFTVPADADRCTETYVDASGYSRCELPVGHDGEHVWRNDAEAD